MGLSSFNRMRKEKELKESKNIVKEDAKAEQKVKTKAEKKAKAKAEIKAKIKAKKEEELAVTNKLEEDAKEKQGDK